MEAADGMDLTMVEGEGGMGLVLVVDLVLLEG